MKIYFCDKCNESIPLKDIESNRISIDAGKIYCQDCAPKTSRPGVTINYPTLAVAVLLGVGLGMVAMAVWGDAILKTGPSESVESQVAGLRRTLDDLRDRVDERLGAVERDLDETPGVDGEAGKLARVLQGIRANSDAIQNMRHAFNGVSDELNQRLEKHEKLMSQYQADIDKDLKSSLLDTADKLVGDVDGVRESLSVLGSDLRELAQRVAALEENPPPAAGEGAGEAAPVAEEDRLPPKDEKRLRKVLAQLESKDAPKRFAAVVDLLEFKTRRAEQAMVDVLDDEAEYVQTAALSNLMEMNARWTIPHVIQKLKDPNVFVREQAIATLEKLIGRSIALDPNATTAKILAKIRELERWWDENKKSVLTG